MFTRKKKEEAKKDPLVKKLDELIWVRHFARTLNISTLVASAGGNILHAIKLPVPIILALIAPLALMGAFELLSRVPIRKGAGKGAVTWLAIRILATTGIAGGTAWISYFHQRDGIYDQTHDLTQAMLLPAIIDFLMITSAGTLLELNIQVRDLEAAIAGIKKAPVVTTVAPKKGKPEDQKAATIAQIWSRSPQLSVKEIASLADTSYNYTHKIIGKLKAALETEPEPAIV